MNEQRYELTSDQADLFRSIGHLPLSALNLPARIVVESPVDEEKALQALKITVTNLPYCRMQLHRNPDGSGCQYVNEEVLGVGFTDLSDKTESQADRLILKMARESFPNNGLDVPLYNFQLIRYPGGRHILFFNILHIIADAYAMMTAVSYFDRVYGALTHGEKVPEISCDIEKLIESYRKHDDPARLEKHNAYVRSLYATEPHFTSVNGSSSHEFVKGKQYGKRPTLLQYKARILRKRIPAELAERVVESSQITSVPPAIYYMLAFRTYCGIVSCTDDVMFVSTSSRRATLVEKSGGLSVAHPFLNRSVIPGNISYQDALSRLNCVQNDGYRHADAHTAILQAEEEKRLGTPENCFYAPTIFTFQQALPVANANLRFRIEFLGFENMITPLYINMLPVDASGDIGMDCYFAFRYIRQESLEKFHDFMLKFTDAGLKRPEKNVRELAELCL